MVDYSLATGSLALNRSSDDGDRELRTVQNGRIAYEFDRATICLGAIHVTNQTRCGELWRLSNECSKESYCFRIIWRAIGHVPKVSYKTISRMGYDTEK